jgi:cell division FtsZ-interacting protein ZapD
MSSLLKSEVKISTAQEIGIRMDDLLEQARQEVQNTSGALAALNEATRAISKLLDIAEEDITNETLDIAAGKSVSFYINRAITILENLSRHTGNMQITANGRVQAYERAVQSVSAYQETERDRLRALLAHIEKTGKDNTEATRPDPSLKEQRLAEEVPSAH